jgi:hypothetical protein
MINARRNALLGSLRLSPGRRSPFPMQLFGGFMHTRFRWLAAILASALLLGLFTGVAPALADEEKSLVWERLDVDLVVQPNGDIQVTEHHVIRFTSGSFTFGYRDIPQKNFNSIDNWSLSDSEGNQYQQVPGGDTPFTFSVADSDGSYIVNWYFPSNNSRGDYTLRYTVRGGLRYYDDGDQLFWNAIFPDRGFPIEASQVRVLVPEPAQILQYTAYVLGIEAPGYFTAEKIGDNDQGVVFTLADSLDSYSNFEVRVRFTPGVVAGGPQPWQVAADEEVARQAEFNVFKAQYGPLLDLVMAALCSGTAKGATSPSRWWPTICPNPPMPSRRPWQAP